MKYRICLECDDGDMDLVYLLNVLNTHALIDTSNEGSQRTPHDMYSGMYGEYMLECIDSTSDELTREPPPF